MSIRPAAKSRNRRALVVAVTAALGALAIAGATLGYVLADDDATPKASAPSASAKSPACAEVTRQYTWWNQETRAIVGLPNLGSAEAKVQADKLIEASDSLRATLQLYRGAPVADLADAVLDYQTEVQMLTADLSLGAKVDTLALGGALLAQQEADDAYTAFLRSSC